MLSIERNPFPEYIFRPQGRHHQLLFK